MTSMYVRNWIYGYDVFRILHRLRDEVYRLYHRYKCKCPHLEHKSQSIYDDLTDPDCFLDIDWLVGGSCAVSYLVSPTSSNLSPTNNDTITHITQDYTINIFRLFDEFCARVFNWMSRVHHIKVTLHMRTIPPSELTFGFDLFIYHCNITVRTCKYAVQ